MSSLFVRVDKKQYGPLTKAELRDLARQGKFTPDDWVWNEDEGQWIEAARLEELQGLFRQEVVPEGEKVVLAIGGGKGGVGKTVITASIGVGLAAVGKQVVLVDADLGGANLHTCMGIVEPQFTLYDFYTLQCNTLADILLDTPAKNLKMISGACGTLGLANPKYTQKVRFIKELRHLPADYILLDLGGGSSYNVIDFFLAAENGIIITTPEPAAVQETFNFIKVCLLRKLKLAFREDPEVMALLDRDQGANLTRLDSRIEEVLQQVRKLNGASASVFEGILASFQPKLLLNMVMSPEEVKEGMAVKVAAHDLLSVEVDYLGFIEYDEKVRQSVKDFRPFLLEDPSSKASRSLAKLITLKLLEKKGLSAYLEKRKMKREIKISTEELQLAESQLNPPICSVRCFYWGDCEFQNGGYPCSVRHFESLFRS